MFRPAVRPLAAIALGVLLVGGLQACGGDPDPDPTPETSAPPTASAPASATTEPPVVPASGPVLEMPAVSVNLPAGWRRDDDLTDFLASGNGGDVSRTMSLSQLPALDPGVSAEGLERSTDEASFGSRGRVLAPVVVAGVEMRHLRGRDGSRVEDVFVTLVDGDVVGISVAFGRSVSDSEREAVLDAVLASVVWR